MSNLNDDQTLRLLRIAASDLPQPVSDLCARLRAHDGAFWMREELQRAAGAAGCTQAALVEGTAGLETLRAMKDAATRRSRDAGHARDQLAALLVHDLVVAAGLAHHGVLLSRHRREEIDERLIALAAAVAEPWRSLLRRAADREEAGGAEEDRGPGR